MSDHASKLKGLLWLGAGLALGVSLALGLAPLAHAVPWAWEKKLGHVLEADMPRACASNPRAEALLKQLVARLYPLTPEDSAFSVEVSVVPDKQVNAFATLGGNIYVNSGLLARAESAEEVAGVLAHEIGHVQNRHIMQGAFQHLLTAQGVGLIFGDTGDADWASTFLNMNFTRAQEAQADADGLKRLQAAHVDNHGFKRFFERMAAENNVPAFLSDHPADADRISMVERFENKEVQPVMTAEEWKVVKDYCGKK